MCRADAFTRPLETAIIILLLATPASADVTFFLQREGSPDDNGRALFIEAIGDYAEQDFEDPALGADGARLSTIPVGDFQLEIYASLSDGTPYYPFLFSSSEFDVEGKLYHLALVCGSTSTLTLQPDQLLGAFGAWIFDDGNRLDSAYLIEVTELDGNTQQAVLENEIPLNDYNFEIEGFFGVVSDVGIAELSITAIDPATGQIHLDVFEIDHLMVAGLPVIDEGDDDDDEDDVGDEDGDGDSRCLNPRGKRLHRHRRHKCAGVDDDHPSHRVAHSLRNSPKRSHASAERDDHPRKRRRAHGRRHRHQARHRNRASQE